MNWAAVTEKIEDKHTSSYGWVSQESERVARVVCGCASGNCPATYTVVSPPVSWKIPKHSVVLGNHVFFVSGRAVSDGRSIHVDSLDAHSFPSLRLSD
jgi:hypothetical protein